MIEPGIWGRWLAGIGLLAALSACEQKKTAAPPPPPEVEVVEIQQRNVPIYREWVGSLSGEVNATISAQVNGYLLSRNYEEGSTVTNGQVLFQIDPAPFEATLARAQAELLQSQARKGKTAQDVTRYRPLAASDAISKKELDDAIQADLAADAQIDSAKAQVLQARLNLDFTTIRAPVDGVAGLAQAQIGNLVGPATGPLTTVAQIHPIRVIFSVSQQLMTQMQERALAEGRSLQSSNGPPIELILATGSTYPHKGRVRFANNQVDVRTGTIRVVGEFPNPNGLLAPGMFTRVRGLLETQTNALIVPQRALTDIQGRYLIAVVDADNKVSVRPVTVGEQIGSEWIIKGLVQPGDRIVAEGVQKVRDGSPVRPVAAADRTAPSPRRS